MKKKTLTIVSSCAAIAVCSSLIVGSTYALFTSKDTVNIAVTAGKVAVTAEVVDSSLALTSMGEEQDGLSWANGGTAGFTDKKNLDLTYITPGDGATFDIKITNESTVNVQYRVLCSAEGAFGEALVVNTSDAGIEKWQEWKVTDEVKEKTISLSVELPAAYEDEYGVEGSVQGEKTTVRFTVEAVQGNAAVYDYEASNEEELLAAINEGGIIGLKNDVALTGIIQATKDLTIDGNGNSLIVPENDDRVINLDGLEEAVTITLSNIDIVGPSSGTYTRGISVFNCKDVKIVMDNCSLSANYYALNIASQNENIEVIVKNSTLTGWAASQTHSANSKVTFENCTLIGINDKTYNADGWNNFATFVINETATNSELTFKNCTIKSVTVTGNKQYFLSIRTDATVNCENCTFIYNDNTLTDLNEEIMPLISAYPGITINFTYNGESSTITTPAE